MAVLFLPPSFFFFFGFFFVTLLNWLGHPVQLNEGSNGGRPYLNTDFEMFLAFYP